MKKTNKKKVIAAAAAVTIVCSPTGQLWAVDKNQVARKLTQKEAKAYEIKLAGPAGKSVQPTIKALGSGVRVRAPQGWFPSGQAS
jgi:hypothetical protein